MVLKPNADTYKQRYDHLFFSAMTLLLLATFFIGFASSYYLAGVVTAPLPSKIIHIHAIVFTIWMLLLATQVSLTSTNKINLHRSIGIIAFFFTPIMIVTGLMSSVDALKRKIAPGLDELLFIVNISMVLVFGVFIAFAYKMRSVPQSHKRLILMANIALTFAAFVRWPVDFLFHNIPNAAHASYVFVLLIAIYDYWCLKKIHRVTLWSSAFLIIIFETRFLFAKTMVWHDFTAWIQSHIS